MAAYVPPSPRTLAQRAGDAAEDDVAARTTVRGCRILRSAWTSWPWSHRRHPAVRRKSATIEGSVDRTSRGGGRDPAGPRPCGRLRPGRRIARRLPPCREHGRRDHTRCQTTLSGRCRAAEASPGLGAGPAEEQPNRRSIPVPTVSMRQLLEAGVHFGHQTRRWNPKMRPFIFAERNGIHIIDLAQTVKRLDLALDAIRETTARGEQVLFVGTKKQAQEPIIQESERAGQPYVTSRWLGGMLTNFVTIKKRLGLLEQLEAL